MPDALDANSRGILDPGRMREHVDFVRVDPGERLRGIVQWFWAVTWRIQEGEFVQPVLAHPSANISVGFASSRGIDSDAVEATLVGVHTTIDRRRLRGTGWNVAAKLQPGALGAFVPSASAVTDRIRPLDEALPVDAPSLVSRITAAASTVEEQVAVLESTLANHLESVDSQRLATIREVVGIASRVETDRGIRSVADLARITGWSARQLQRSFREFAGVSPLWMIRRYRLIEAADAARDGTPPSWAQLAANLGYADQAHLSREFKQVMGVSPSQYAAQVRPLASSR